MSHGARSAPPEATTSSRDEDEIGRLRARIAALERRLASRGDPARDARETAFRDALYEAMLYGLARTLSLYDAASVRILVREMGRRIREYLEEVGYDLGSPHTADEALDKAVSFFVDHGFVDLEIVDRREGVVHARWRHLLGLRAYARIAATGASTFISCPLNAVIHDGLAAFGKELTLCEKHFDLDAQIAESWEEIVDIGPEVLGLSLDADRVLEVEREQSRQLRVRDEFIRVASHELATPLTSTKLAMARIERMDLPDRAARSLQVVRRQIQKLERVVAEMLDTTRLQIGRLDLDCRPVDLVEIAGEVVDSLAVGGERGAQVELSGDAALVGCWDPSRIEQIVTNLLTNAVKYGEGRPIDVVVRARGERAILSVRDRGIGIPEEAIGRIFDPFERAVPVEKYGGLGLGLYIARRFVEMHGGVLSVESALGEGATFTVDLPIERPRGADVLKEVPLSTREDVP